jgi:drug/metabolite transporter (DMT)-like permease
MLPVSSPTPGTIRPDAHGVGIALCVASAVGYGLMAILADPAYDAGFSLAALLVVRFGIAALAFWGIVAARRTPVRGLPARAVAIGVGLGAVGYAAQSGAFFGALQHMDASLVALLLYTFPGMVVLAGLALGRARASRRTVTALGLASGGTALVLLGGGTGDLAPLGVALGLAAAVVYTTYILVAEHAGERLDPFLLAALIATGAATTWLVAGLAGAGLAWGSGTGGWAASVAIALACTVVPAGAFLLGLRLVGASTASIVSTVEPVVTVVLAVALLGETLGPWQLVGGALVLGAVLVLQLKTPVPEPAH